MKTTLRLFALVLLALPGPASAQSQLPQVKFEPEMQALIEIKARMARALEEMPNYTCAETIRRTQLNEKDRRQIEKMIARGKDVNARIQRDFSDTVRLDVAVVDGREMFSWPGAEFQPVPPEEITW